MKGSRLALLLQSSYTQLRSDLDSALGQAGQCYPYRDTTELQMALQAIHQHNFDGIGVLGNDAELAHVYNTLHRAYDTPQLPLLPIPWSDGPKHVARELGMSNSDPRTIAEQFARLSRNTPRLLRRRPTITRISRATIRVLLATQPDTTLAFTVGMGIAGQPHTSSRRALARDVAQSFVRDVNQRLKTGEPETFPAKVVADHNPTAETVSLGIASTLQYGPLALQLAARPLTTPGTFHLLWSQRNLALTMAALRLPKPFREGIRTTIATHVNLDIMAPIALDGVAVEGGGPFALGLRPGPTIQLLQLT
ncbi:MAG: hypothetical protein AAFS10_15355 [Myxococcota bacterium]